MEMLALHLKPDNHDSDVFTKVEKIENGFT